MEISEVMNFEKFAQKTAKKMVEEKLFVIGITGISCIGKSTLANIIADNINSSSCIISVDDFLKEQYRGDRSYQGSNARILKPELYDRIGLNTTVQRILSGKAISIPCYQRGIGWKKEKLLMPSSHIIIEGLFLDSYFFSELIHYDLLLRLEASRELIIKLRRERDEYYRKSTPYFPRSPQQTEQEIQRTFLVNESYQKNESIKNLHRLYINENFNITEF